jgi:23S rRNA (guanine745-N1)-methyltransferase
MEKCVQPLICPVCEANLAQAGNTLKCPQSHSFDVSREGYVNLHLARRKRPQVLGDTKIMLRARRDFLDREYYRPLSDAINERVYHHLADGADARSGPSPIPMCIAEVGCGEGTYIGRLKHYLDSQPMNRNICYFGMDISKEAARLAARRYRDIRFVVASVWRRILFSSHSIQVLLNIFAPRNGAEFDRVITRDGMLLVAIPSPDHLMNLRSDLGLLGIEPHKEQRVIEQFRGAFKLTGKQTIAFEMHLTGVDMLNLIQMTPNYWHISISRETRDAIQSAESARTEASFTILQFHSRPTGRLGSH